MKLIFENSSGKRRVIYEPLSIKSAFEVMKIFAEERNFKIKYYRCTFFKPGDDFNTPFKLDKITDNTIWIDVGSWSEFFYITGYTDEQLKEWQNGR